MNTRQRDVVFQRWSGAIRRETRDFASLEQFGARALADPDVRRSKAERHAGVPAEPSDARRSHWAWTRQD